MNYEVCIMNHIARDITDLTNRLTNDQIPFTKFTDTSNFRLEKKTKNIGVLTNFLNIIDHISKLSLDKKGAILIHDDVTFSKEVYNKICYVIDQSDAQKFLSFFNPSNNQYREC